MSFLNSILGRSANAPAPTAPAQPQPAAPDHAAPPAVDLPEGEATPQEAPKGVEALELLFKAQEAEGDKIPSLNLTPEVMNQVTETVNFMSGVTEDMLAQVSSGDTKALMAVIQQVGRNSYQQAMMHSAELNSQFASSRADYAAQQAAKGIRGHVIESQVDVSNLSPAAQGMFRAIATKVAERNPTASASEVQAQATSLLQELANEFNYEGKQKKASEPAPTDWSSVFN